MSVSTNLQNYLKDLHKMSFKKTPINLIIIILHMHFILHKKK